jgi:hypothetical protein
LVFSYEYWKRNYGGDPKVVGRTFRMNDRIHTVVGVLPPVPQYPDDNDVYMPTSACPFRSDAHMIASRTGRMMSVFGRLQDGVTLEQSQQELPPSPRGYSKLIPMRTRRTWITAYIRHCCERI